MTDLQAIEGTPEQLATLLQRLPSDKRYRLVEVETLPTEQSHSPATFSEEPRERVARLLEEWRTQDEMPERPSIQMLTGETPTEALFRKWAEEDANLTDQEIEADQRLWEEFQQGIDETRSVQQMRRLF